MFNLNLTDQRFELEIIGEPLTLCDPSDPDRGVKITPTIGTWAITHHPGNISKHNLPIWEAHLTDWPVVDLTLDRHLHIHTSTGIIALTREGFDWGTTWEEMSINSNNVFAGENYLAFAVESISEFHLIARFDCSSGLTSLECFPERNPTRKYPLYE